MGSISTETNPSPIPPPFRLGFLNVPSSIQFVNTIPGPTNEVHFFVVVAMHPVSLLLLLAGALSALAGVPFALTGNSLAGPQPMVQTPSLAPQTCQADEVAGKQWNMTWLPAFFSR